MMFLMLKAFLFGVLNVVADQIELAQRTSELQPKTIFGKSSNKLSLFYIQRFEELANDTHACTT